MKYIDIKGDESIEELNSIISSNINTYNKMKKELEELLEAEAKEKEEKEQTYKKTTIEKICNKTITILTFGYRKN